MQACGDNAAGLPRSNCAGFLSRMEFVGHGDASCEQELDVRQKRAGRCVSRDQTKDVASLCYVMIRFCSITELKHAHISLSYMLCDRHACIDMLTTRLKQAYLL